MPKCGLCKQDSCIPCLPYCIECLGVFRLIAKADQHKAKIEDDRNWLTKHFEGMFE